MRRTSPAALLAERFCRPHRVGLFGHRGVGKTTLLTMLYREAVGGRLPDLRLAAADVPTADYLSDKVVQLEAGQTLPATLAETDLRFHLYHQQSRLELVLRDYQGEHVELGREGAIQEFLRDCDAVWLCLDLTTVPEAAARLRRQQEIEHLVEDYLKCEPRPTLERPMALVLTKADLLEKPPADIDELARSHFGMTRHALQAHCPQNGAFAISALAPIQQPTRSASEGSTPARSASEGPGQYALAGASGLSLLAGPLLWLAQALQALDESRLERIWRLAPGRVSLLDRCVRVFARRYPDAPATAAYQQRLRDLKRRRRWQLISGAVAAATCLLVGLWTYDAWGYQQVLRHWMKNGEDPQRVLENLERFQAQHPTRYASFTSTPEQEESWRNELTQRIRERDRDQRLAELRRQAADPDTDPAAVWQLFQGFRAAHPDVNIDGDLEQLRAAIKARRDEQFNQQARRALDELLRAAQRSDDLAGVVKQADRFLLDFAGSVWESEARACRALVLGRLDEQDIQQARAYSARNPLNFQTRKEHYQRYLVQHPTGGAFTKEAEGAIRTIMADWDRHDFRAVRDHYVKTPGSISGLVAHCRRYLAVHPDGRFKTSATELLRWSERVSAVGEYKVVLRSGEFDSTVSRWFTRGPKLSVELEVAGIKYGPSTIVYNTYYPQWDYEFPRKVRWKLGDPIVIRVTEHSWSNRTPVEIWSDGNDPLALKMLTGEVQSGNNKIVFECNFTMPVLPRIE